MPFFAICNDPFERNRYTHPYVTWDKAFEDKELDIISDLCEKENLDYGSVLGREEMEVMKSVRNSQIKFFHVNAETAWIFNRFNSIIGMINDQFYGFNLNGYESFQYTVYKGEEQGKYDWHMDTFLGNNLQNADRNQTRKLSIVMLLSEPDKDFTGGELEINIGKEENAMKTDIFKGRIVAFPSFLIHRVKPVLTGIRKSIVIWVEGPKFV